MTHLLDQSPPEATLFTQSKNALTEWAVQRTAAAFLKAALGPDLTLHQLHAALSFVAQRVDLTRLRLSDILPVRPMAAPSASRRQAAQTRLMERDVRAALDNSPEGLSTLALRAALGALGHTVTTAQVNGLLKRMVQAGGIVSSATRPRIWRRRGVLQPARPGVVIRPAISPAARTDVVTRRQSMLFS